MDVEDLSLRTFLEIIDACRFFLGKVPEIGNTFIYPIS
jgi:hypothetical protein